MGYGAPLKNQNKGYDAQEKKDLIGDMPITRVASGGTFLSKHMSPISMSMGKGAPNKMIGGKTGDESANTKKQVKEIKASAKKDYK